MVSLRRLPIKWKLQLIIIFTSGTALLFASIASIVINVIEKRQTIQNDLSSLAEVIGINSLGALVFDDEDQAKRNLAALRAKPYVLPSSVVGENSM